MKSLTPETIRPLSISITKSLWRKLIVDLRQRGAGKRESGAFLLAIPESRQITHFVCYDDFDPSCYDTGIIVFQGSAYRSLWDYCAATGLQVIADVHTHPGQWTAQSKADKEHPMIVQQGHISLIVPRYAKRNIRSVTGIGFHSYQGDHQWVSYSINQNLLNLL